MFKLKSLRKEVNRIGSDKFKEIFPPSHLLYLNFFMQKVNSKNGWIFIIVIPLLFMGLGQFFNPFFFQFINISDTLASAIIDQRISNLATIFSITLVVIGWLITNISVKEAISYKLLFHRTHLYPIFYYVISLVGCLMIASLTRDSLNLDLGKIVISATYLILFAFILITFLFVRLIEVVSTNFFYSSLEKEVLKEVYKVSKEIIVHKLSSKIYSELCKDLGFIRGIPFGLDLTDFNGINITVDKNLEPFGKIDDLFGGKKKYQIRDIDIGTISKQFQTINLKGNNYFRQLNLNIMIYENFFPFQIFKDNGDLENIKKKIAKSFYLSENIKEITINQPNYISLNEKFKKDVKDGKKENIESAFKIYSKIFELENRIFKECTYE